MIFLYGTDCGKLIHLLFSRIGFVGLGGMCMRLSNKFVGLSSLLLVIMLMSGCILASASEKVDGGEYTGSSDQGSQSVFQVSREEYIKALAKEREISYSEALDIDNEENGEVSYYLGGEVKYCIVKKTMNVIDISGVKANIELTAHCKVNVISNEDMRFISVFGIESKPVNSGFGWRDSGSIAKIVGESNIEFNAKGYVDMEKLYSEKEIKIEKGIKSYNTGVSTIYRIPINKVDLGKLDL